MTGSRNHDTRRASSLTCRTRRRLSGHQALAARRLGVIIAAIVAGLVLAASLAYLAVRDRQHQNELSSL